ncbi:hypothetical protein [Thiohalobacter thiocyanaticus]|uniref:Uncharacterized protein n=1 Tax=Thiohalobacter thiocyanaticus TaxID=585455 RepID=A0A426QHN9_9GAMM|nr:hypothetical protein [Thiohalobacter thiocyanaticus]RRQ21267.1 hypothetical protein D6C00_04405 [Thiohalobacter thiocyanaticus]
MNPEDPWSAVHGGVRLHPDYVQGCSHLAAGDVTAAAACFEAADEQTAPNDVYSSLYTAARGYARVLLNDTSGLNLCRAAARAEQHNGDVHEYLAKAELRLQHRKQACEAIVRGLRADRAHPGLRQLRRQMGIRRAPALGFLSRDNLLNRLIGRLTYQRGGGRSGPRKK